LKQTISKLEADNAELQEQIRLATESYEDVENQRDLTESKLSLLERSSKNTYHQLMSLKASYDALTTKLRLADKRASAAIKRVAYVESQLSYTQVS
jgi:chromosome segregation ATPase